jgi:hypothetical protein
LFCLLFEVLAISVQESFLAAFCSARRTGLQKVKETDFEQKVTEISKEGG